MTTPDGAIDRAQEPDDNEVTRRRLLAVAGSGLAVITAGGWLAACGGSSGSSAASGPAGSPAAGGTPKRGGTLRVGATGGGEADTLDAQSPLNNVDIPRNGALFEGLVHLNAAGEVEMVLAESIESNRDGTLWTIKIRPGVKFHDGQTLDAHDVLYSLRRIEAKKFAGLASFGPINLKAAKVVDPLTLRIPFDEPYSVFPEGLTVNATKVVRRGYDPKKPNGTGPFKFVSFTPGRESVFARHDAYWRTGKPYLDKLVISNFADETAQVNALQAGQVDVIDQLSAASVAAVKGAGAQVIISKTASGTVFTMRADTPPFDDVRVRQALRLAIDRKAMNEQVFGGLGTVANDLLGATDPAFDRSIPPREQDLDKARSLLKAAGHPTLRATLVTTPVGPGEVPAAAVFAAQVKAAGVQVTVKEQDPTQFFANSYSKVPLAMSYWNTLPYLTFAGQAIAKGAFYNEIHQTDPTWQRLYDQAVRTVDKPKRAELIRRLLRFDYDKGGYIVPFYYPNIEGAAAAVRGITENRSGFPINNSDGWHEVWLDA